MRKLIATTTWNNCDIVRLFLDYSRALGFDRILVMDFDSTDGTADLLRSEPYRDFVEATTFPGLAGLDSSGLLLEKAKRCSDVDSLCLFCDPDEFLVLPPGFGWQEWSQAMGPAVVVPRFNVTGCRAAAVSAPGLVTPLGSLNLRIERRVRRNPLVDMYQDELTPPWIYSDIPGKVFVRPERTLAITDGDHGAILADAVPRKAPDGMYLLHFPIRSYQEFEAKVRLNAIDFEANQHLPQGYGWQCRRWVRLANQGRLRNEYLQQFPVGDSVRAMVRDGRLVVDTSVPRGLRVADVAVRP